MDVTTLRSLPNCIKHSEDTAKALEGDRIENSYNNKVIYFF